MAVLAPIPRASVSTATAVKPGFFNNWRRANLRSLTSEVARMRCGPAAQLHGDAQEWGAGTDGQGDCRGAASPSLSVSLSLLSSSFSSSILALTALRFNLRTGGQVLGRICHVLRLWHPSGVRNI